MSENGPMTTAPYAPEQDVRSVEDCFFYHSMDLPGIGSVSGEWDLRGRLDDYLGPIELSGKRVLDVGTASGFLCFEIEKRGADVVGFDLEDGAAWDLVPFGGCANPADVITRHNQIQRLHRSWWLARRAYGSRARVAYGNVYDIPESLGRFDIAVVGCLLLHLRDPFRALESVARLTDESLVVIDVVPGLSEARRAVFKPPAPGLLPAGTPATMRFVPDPLVAKANDTWWSLSPGIVARFLQVLGFGTIEVRYHLQRIHSDQYWLYTVEGRRAGTSDQADVAPVKPSGPLEWLRAQFPLRRRAAGHPD